MAWELFLDKKRTLILLQWLIVISISYLALFNDGTISEDPKIYGLVVIFFGSVLILYRLPERTFSHRLFDGTLLIADTLLISFAIYGNRNVPWDLFLFYFLVMFIAAIGGSTWRIVAASVLIGLVYLGVLVQQGSGLAEIRSEMLVRIPFLLGVSLLYGYLLESANREKRRAETAEQRERLKMDLVSALAHDIKNPLGIITGYVDVLADALAEQQDQNANLQAVARIRENIRRLVNLLTGFLEAGKAESGRTEIAEQPVSINQLLRDAARQQESAFERKNLNVELNLDERVPLIQADQTQLDRAFWNLISNAIKFTPHGGKITISSTLDNGHVAVAVQDTGIGMPRDQLPLLFTQFRRLKGAAKIEGTGLGLFIVKTIVEAHKGNVHAESEDGRGSTFVVHLPIRSKPADA